MRFREDWLADVIRVPYVPTLGPVHPQADLPELFEAVVSLARVAVSSLVEQATSAVTATAAASSRKARHVLARDV